MATHEIKPYANMTRSRDKAPFLARYVQKKTVSFEELVADVAKESGMTDIEVRTILEGTPEIIEALERETLTRFRLPGGIMIEPVAYGSLDAANSAWDSEKNSLELAFRMDDEYRNHLANVTPTIITDVTITKADIHRVFDIEVPQPTSLIHGEHPFRIQGKKLFPKAVYLENAIHQRFECDVITQDPDGNAYEAKSRDLLEPGDYKLIVETDAGDPEGIIQYPSKNVKYLYVEPTELKILKVFSNELNAEDKVNLFDDEIMIFSNMKIPEGSTAALQILDKATGALKGETRIEDGTYVTQIDEKTLKLRLFGNTSPQPDGVWEMFDSHIYLMAIMTPDGNSCTHEVTPVISKKR